jgi:hypothetical protein
VLQLEDPCARLQPRPQPSQLVAVWSWVSQPSLAVPSLGLQSSQLSAQLRISQLPEAQVGIPCALVHEVAQAPQSVRELSWVSQPLFLLPSQSPQPLAHSG